MFVEKLVATQSVGYTAMLESRSYYSWLVGNRLLQATAMKSLSILKIVVKIKNRSKFWSENYAM